MISVIRDVKRGIDRPFVRTFALDLCTSVLRALNQHEVSLLNTNGFTAMISVSNSMVCDNDIRDITAVKPFVSERFMKPKQMISVGEIVVRA